MKKVTLSIILFFISLTALAGVQLPLHNLRDQAYTSHCWAYAMSNMLESRALQRENLDFMVNVEKDVKYWVDYERMMYIYKTKGDFYLGDNEGGWQVEYWEALLKHGRQISKSSINPAQILYKPTDDYMVALTFMEEPRPTPEIDVYALEDVKDQLRALKTDAEAEAFIRDFLDKWYGKPKMMTTWFDQEISIADTKEKMMGSEYADNKDVESMVLVKPTKDADLGWVKYLDDRYWGYRYDRNQILSLIEKSLTNGWPVTFDDVYHAMTIVGFDIKENIKYYAVADSIPGKITWYQGSYLIDELNLVTFAAGAIKGELPPRPTEQVGQRNNKRLLKKYGKSVDELDNVQFPPQ